MEDNEPQQIGTILLEIGALLMSSGATTERIRTTINRIAQSYDCQVELLVTNRALMLSIQKRNFDHYFSSLKRTSPHGVNFRIVSGISRMSWRIVDEHWPLDKIKEELDRLTHLPPYNRWIILGLVGLAGASFCRILDGTYLEMGITFLATFIGLFVRQEAVQRKFNPYLCTFFASFSACLVSGIFKYGFHGVMMDHAYAAGILFLTPGVPLINAFTDFIDGNMLNGMVRFLHAFMTALSIAMGLLTTMLIFQF